MKQRRDSNRSSSDADYCLTTIGKLPGGAALQHFRGVSIKPRMSDHDPKSNEAAEFAKKGILPMYVHVKNGFKNM